MLGEEPTRRLEIEGESLNAHVRSARWTACGMTPANRKGTKNMLRPLPSTVSATAPTRQVPTVILAEDNAHLRKETAQHIRTLGYAVSEAANGTELIQAIAATCFGPGQKTSGTVVVSDLVNGRTVLDTLRMLREHPKCPSLILVTCSDAAKVREEARLLGALAVLDRPLDLAALTAILITQLPPSWRASDPAARAGGSASPRVPRMQTEAGSARTIDGSDQA
jgi:CheY-like chemotaxis protein